MRPRPMRREARPEEGSDEEALTQFIDLRKTKKVRRTFADPPLSLSMANVFRFQTGMGGKLRSYFDD